MRGVPYTLASCVTTGGCGADAAGSRQPATAKPSLQCAEVQAPRTPSPLTSAPSRAAGPLTSRLPAPASCPSRLSSCSSPAVKELDTSKKEGSPPVASALSRCVVVVGASATNMKERAASCGGGGQGRAEAGAVTRGRGCDRRATRLAWLTGTWAVRQAQSGRRGRQACIRKSAAG